MEVQEFLSKVTESTGGMFKFGRGLVGKSSVVLAVLLIAVVSAVWKLQEPVYIMRVLGFGGFVFLVWFLFILHYATKHPETTLLEGAEWRGYKEFQATSKSLSLPPSTPSIPDPGHQLSLPQSTEPDK